VGKAIWKGIVWSFVGIFPAAVLVGLLYRFPIPFFGYTGGWAAFREGPLAVLSVAVMIIEAVGFYIIFGGEIALLILGIVAGLIGWWFGRPDRAERYARNIALGLACAAAIVPSVLEFVIGPW
jgi:hypothetical protein